MDPEEVTMRWSKRGCHFEDYRLPLTSEAPWVLSS
jgi:hypothetical protein